MSVKCFVYTNYKIILSGFTRVWEGGGRGETTKIVSNCDKVQHCHWLNCYCSSLKTRLLPIQKSSKKIKMKY